MKEMEAPVSIRTDPSLVLQHGCIYSKQLQDKLCTVFPFATDVVQS